MTEVTRRQFHGFLLGATAAAALPDVARAVTMPILHAREGTARLAPPEYPETQIWGYDGTVPGPMLRARQGERMAQLFRNDLPQASSVHWHGIRIENGMDGVAGLTQPAVEPGEHFFSTISRCPMLAPTGATLITARTSRWRAAFPAL